MGRIWLARVMVMMVMMAMLMMIAVLTADEMMLCWCLRALNGL